MVTIIKTTVLHIRKLLREYTLKVLNTRKKEKNFCNIYGDGCLPDLSW